LIRPRRDKVPHPNLYHFLGACGTWTKTFNQTVITTHVPSRPALARHQLARRDAVLTTHVPMRSALARHQTTHWEAVTTTHPSCNARQNATKHQQQTTGPVWPKEMMTIIKSIVESHSPCPDKPLFEFAMTSEAAEKNFLILKSFDFDMKRALEAQVNSPMGYGSEFQKVNILQPLLQNHPLWPRLTKLLKFGSQWPTSPSSEEDRMANLLEALSFGNHKGASSQPELLKSLSRATSSTDMPYPCRLTKSPAYQAFAWHP
jgi:hypothetical protein